MTPEEEARAGGPGPASVVDKWMRRWAEQRTFEAHLDVDEEQRRGSAYIVSMFPYPSGDLHMGHAEVYSITDCLARFARMRGRNTLLPIGWDSFGLPAENAAFKRNLDPRAWTYANIEVQAESFRRLGVSFDWRSRFHTSDPEYYRWNQWLFLRLFERGLAFRQSAAVNWCPEDETVLANEQVVQGCCERCGSQVVQRELTQWFFKMTAYAQRLLDDMDRLEGNWPDDILAMQRNWIGRSEGARLAFPVEGRAEPVRVFTTRPDTVFGATFLVVAADAALATELCADEQRAALDEYRAATSAATRIERLSTGRPKTGVFLGRHAINPATGERVPVYAADYVLPEYGAGAIMAVPAHDQRDLDFARAFGLPVRVVIDTGEPHPGESGTATTGAGTLIDSGEFSGLSTADAGRSIVDSLGRDGNGEPAVSYRLRDWLLSRQRYWGTPIPIIHCAQCGLVPVPDEDLPVALPNEGYQLRADGGKSPLETCEPWVAVTCPKCGGDARRDTDTMDTFVDSSWYFLRYPNAAYEDGPFDPDAVRRWLPVDRYIGGKEHATGHLLYARFMTKVLHDMGLLDFTEPFTTLTNQGQVIMNGKAMSKSLGNLVDLQEQIDLYGPDAVRVTMVFAGPAEDDIDWADVSVAGAVKWLARVWRLANEAGSGAEENQGTTAAAAAEPGSEKSGELRRRVHRLIEETTDLMERGRLNVAVARLMSLTGVLRKAVDASGGSVDAAVQEGIEALVRMLACFAPYTAEEAWERLGHSSGVDSVGWPSFDPALTAQPMATCVIQVEGKVRDRIEVAADIDDDALREAALASAKVAELVAARQVTRVVVRAPKLVNILLE
ncbi:MAG TPA: leucine--tRNA ligase [Actinocrinis sp.]|nr:leucine--tRNA ligase [Actinocrinis sp.]